MVFGEQINGWILKLIKITTVRKQIHLRINFKLCLYISNALNLHKCYLTWSILSFLCTGYQICISCPCFQQSCMMLFKTTIHIEPCLCTIQKVCTLSSLGIQYLWSTYLDQVYFSIHWYGTSCLVFLPLKGVQIQ